MRQPDTLNPGGLSKIRVPAYYGKVVALICFGNNRILLINLFLPCDNLLNFLIFGNMAELAVIFVFSQTGIISLTILLVR
jgi:hypothetical protein